MPLPEPSPLTLAAVNRMTRAEFAAALGGVFEHSQWVAEAAWPAAPFADVAALHRAMVAAVREASPERQLALIRAYPDLAGKAARHGTMTPQSAAPNFPSTLNDAHKTILVPYFKTFGTSADGGSRDPSFAVPPSHLERLFMPLSRPPTRRHCS